MATLYEEHNNERVGVEYKGPYSVSMNRYLLEKSEKGHAGKLLNKLRSHWIDCFLFVYPSDNRLLVYHSVKGKKEAFKYLLGVREVLPTLSHIQYEENRSNVLLLEGLITCNDTDSAAKDLMVAFETLHDRKAFEDNVRSFTRSKKPGPVAATKKEKRGTIMAQIPTLAVATIVEDDLDESMEIINTVFCEECALAFDSAEMYTRLEANDELVYMCPEGHECESPNH